MPNATLHVGDALDTLRDLPDEQFQTCITSPPYWGLRDYGEEGQLGLENMPEEYVQNLVEVFREVRRTLRDDGTLWLNLGDSYARPSGKGGSGTPTDKNNRGEGYAGMKTSMGNLKEKDLSLIPYCVASALQADGWWLRSDIIWKKPNPMPESVTDRPTSSHEHIFLLAKSKQYYYDADAIREELSCPDAADGTRVFGGKQGTRNIKHGERTEGQTYDDAPDGRNKRDVWEVTTKPFPDAHFAVYPPELIEPCIKAGTSKKGECPECGAPWERVVKREEGEPESYKNSRFDTGKTDGHMKGRAQKGERTTRNPTDDLQPTCDCDAGEPVPQTVLDPFGGAMTTPMTAMKLRRDAVAIDLSEEYVQMGAERIRQDAPLMNSVKVATHTAKAVA